MISKKFENKNKYFKDIQKLRYNELLIFSYY